MLQPQRDDQGGGVPEAHNKFIKGQEQYNICSKYFTASSPTSKPTYISEYDSCCLRLDRHLYSITVEYCG